MTIYRINSKDEMIASPRISLDKEEQLEDWLSKSPWAIAEEPLLIIGRQTTARTASIIRYPDLIALDQNANLVIIELKRGRAPRDVVAQTLEYAAWGANLNESDIRIFAEKHINKNIDEEFLNYFETDEVPVIGEYLRLFIAAEEIPESVLNICRFLRTQHAMDISCISYTVYSDTSKHILVDSTILVGNEPIRIVKNNQVMGYSTKNKGNNSWNGDIPVKQLIWQTVQQLSKGNTSFTFSPKMVINQLIVDYPDLNKNTIRCQISSDCVNHKSRHHWPGGIDRYWLISNGRYRLYNSKEDNIPDTQ